MECESVLAFDPKLPSLVDSDATDWLEVAVLSELFILEFRTVILKGFGSRFGFRPDTECSNWLCCARS